MAPKVTVRINRAHTTSYSSFMKLCIYLIHCQIIAELSVESHCFLPTPPALVSLWGDPVQISPKIFGSIKLESLGYHVKLFA